MKNRKITKRVYYALDVVLKSPLNVSGGQDLFSDSDVIRNGSGECFVPGTSLAGAFRNALKLDKKQPGIMGYAHEQDGSMSGIFLSDLYFDREGEKPVLSLRDGVKLSDHKKVKNKFNMEIVETGARGTIFLNFIVRESEGRQKEGEQEEEKKENRETREEEEQRFEKAAAELILRLQSGTIRIGSKRTRGFGRLEIVKIYKREFSKDNLTDFISFKKNFRDRKRYDQKWDFESWKAAQQKKYKALPDDTEYIKIRVPLKLDGGISIRRYSAQPDSSDYEHITCGEKPVIPGSSWSGAIRSGIQRILKELRYENYLSLMEDWFGSIKDKSISGISRESAVVFSESVIEGAEAVPVTRNSINRFDGSTKDGALYSEIAWFGGITYLEIFVKKDESRRYREFLSILELVIQDIQEGYLPVGGQVSIGRGIFRKNGDAVYTEKEKISTASLIDRLEALK